MERLAEMMTFARVVETRSFSAAARAMNTSKSLVSKQVSQLEEALGVRLLNRTTRSMSLTEIGTAYYEHCARIAQEIDAASATVTQLQAEPRGLLKITAPVIFASMHLAPALQTFLQQHPKVEVELNATDRVVDLVEEGCDLALRITDRPAPAMVARRIVPVRWATCAAPAYLERHGVPQTPHDLERHNCLVYHGLHSTSHGWRYGGADGKEVMVPVGGNCRVNNSDVLHKMALHGMGIVLFPTYMVGQDIQAGRLREVLAGYVSYPHTQLYATYLPNRYLQPKVRAFIDHLLACFGPQPAWDRQAAGDSRPA